MSGDLEVQVREFLVRRVPGGGRLCVGYSGGLDSSVLLHILVRLRAELGFHLSAVHVHHGLSVHADAWAQHCRTTCALLAVPLTVRKVAVAGHGTGLEAAARAERYRVYADQDADFIALAHHRDDQAETLLFRLLRGAGAHGLAGMAEARAHAAAVTILRPLLTVARAQLVDYARGHGIGHVDDDSNADLALTRNWLRHTVLPVLEARFPASRATLARTAEQLEESAGLLDDLAEADLARAGSGDDLDLAALAGLASGRARNLLRFWLRRHTGVSPSRAWLVEALDQVLAAGPDRHPRLAVGERWLVRRAGRVMLVSEGAPLANVEWRWRGEAELCLGGHGRLSFRLATGTGLAAACIPAEGARIAGRLGGERLRPDCRRPTRTVKNLLREAAVPARERGGLPMLYLADRLAWVAGLGVDCAFQAGPGEAGWIISWCPPGR